MSVAGRRLAWILIAGGLLAISGRRHYTSQTKRSTNLNPEARRGDLRVWPKADIALGLS
jgi:hypothetical protein